MNKCSGSQEVTVTKEELVSRAEHRSHRFLCKAIVARIFERSIERTKHSLRAFDVILIIREKKVILSIYPKRNTDSYTIL